MLKAARLSKFPAFAGILMLALAFAVTPAFAQTVDLQKKETDFLRDTFDQNIYYDNTSILRFDRFYRILFRKESPARDVNIYDEVPNSSFYTNRHEASRLSADALTAGKTTPAGVNFSGKMEVIGGRFEDARPSFIVKDSSGQSFLLKFDAFSAPELLTSAEVIANRFYHALGYNVVEETIVTHDADQIFVSPGTRVVDSSGFNRAMSSEKLQQLLLSVPRTEKGQLRMVIRKTLPSEKVQSFSFHGKNSESAFPGKNLRSVRALRVFASWLNQDGLYEGNTAAVQEDGGLKYYLLNFDTALGAGGEGAKPPMYGHEHFIDYGESTKAFFTLGLWEKPWQKRWDEAGQQSHPSLAIGYFDNKYFDPAKYKPELPYYAFKDLTRADGFWAAKKIAAFSDDDIRAVVKAGKLTNPDDESYIANTLIERRNMIVNYWFNQATPLEDFSVSGDELRFKDLASASGSTYFVDVFEKQGKKRKKTNSFQSANPSLSLQPSWKQDGELFIRVLRPGASKPHPYVQVSLQNGNVAGVKYQD